MSGPDFAPPDDPGREASDTLFPPDHAVTSLFGRGAVDWPATERQGAELFPAEHRPTAPVAELDPAAERERARAEPEATAPVDPPAATSAVQPEPDRDAEPEPEPQPEP